MSDGKFKWEKGRTRTECGGFTVETIHLTDEAKERLTIKRDRMPLFDRIVFGVLGIVVVAVLAWATWAAIGGG
jgi:hypothetical protein